MRKSFGSKLVEQSNRRDCNKLHNVKVVAGILGASAASCFVVAEQIKNNKKIKTDFSNKAKEIIDKNITAMKYLQDK